MREDQADKIIKLLEEIKEELIHIADMSDNIEANTGDLIDIRGDSRRILDLLNK